MICALCIDNYATYTVETVTAAGRTGAVQCCWPCLSVRVPDLLYDLSSTAFGGKVRLGAVTGFEVRTIAPESRGDR